MLDDNHFKRYRPQFKARVQVEWLVAREAYITLNGVHFHTVSSPNQLNKCHERNVIHYLSSTLKGSQLTFKVIVQKKKKRDTAMVGKHFHFQEPPSLNVWDFSFAVDRVLLGAERHHSGTVLWLWLLSLSFSSLRKYAPIPFHTSPKQPGFAAVWAPLSQQHSMLAGSQQRVAIAVAHNRITEPGDVYLLLQSCDREAWCWWSWCGFGRQTKRCNSTVLSSEKPPIRSH